MVSGQAERDHANLPHGFPSACLGAVAEEGAHITRGPRNARDSPAGKSAVLLGLRRRGAATFVELRWTAAGRGRRLEAAMTCDPNRAPARSATRRALVAAGLCALALAFAPGPDAMAQEEPRPLDAAQTRMPALPPARIDETLNIGGEEVEARKLRSRMTVEVMIDGTGPYRFVVDSGADTSVIGRDIAQALQLPPAPPAILNSMTDSSIVQRALVGELQLGQAVFRGLELPVLHEFDIGAAGMIGLDALVEQRLMLDFDKRVITVDDADSPSPRFDGEIVVRARLSRGQLILTEVETNGKPVEAVIDTGTEITIGNSALRDMLRARSGRDSTVTIAGVTGVEAELQFAKIAEIRLGPVIVRNVAIAFADVPPFAVFGLADQPALLLGTDLMEQFRRVSLDFKARKVRFELRECKTNTVRIRTAPSYASRLSADRPTACAG